MGSDDGTQDSQTQVERTHGAQKRRRADSRLDGDLSDQGSENMTQDSNGRNDRTAPQFPAQHYSSSTNNLVHGRRLSSRVNRLRVPRRNGPRPVKRQRTTYWDAASPINHREVIKERFVNAIRRADQLSKYKLLYEYAAIAEDEIRLLYINPGSKNDDLRVLIEAIPDNEVGPHPLQEYEALSYHWGPGPADKPVFHEQGSESEPMPKMSIEELSNLQKWVPDSGKGQRVYVRPNLDKALRYLRKPDEIVILWVDAICINQSDEKVEKPAQIRKMNKIYNKAQGVCIWLGEGNKDFYAAMDFIAEILNLEDLEKLCHDTRVTKQWSDLLDLIRCSWFSRRWVIQELAFAREATVHCGDHYVHWQDLADAIGLFVVKFESIRALFRQSQDDKIFRNYYAFSELEPLGAKVLVDAITNTFRKSADGDFLEPMSTLEMLVSNLPTFESSDPRDTIYALLNIARESLLPGIHTENGVKPPKPNYEKDLLEVYTDFLEWVVYHTGSIDIICRQWAIPEREIKGGRKKPTKLVTLPSWVQTISKSTYGTQEQGFNGRINGDSLVGRAGRPRYNASHGKNAEVLFGLRWRQIPNGQLPVHHANTAPTILQTMQPSLPVSSPFCGSSGNQTPSHRLNVRGLEIDTVTWTSGEVANGVITKGCLEKAGWKYSKTGEPIVKAPDKLWRTLVADRSAEGENPPPWYHRAALHCMALATNNDHIDTSGILARKEESNLPQIVEEHLKRVQAVTWNRKFFEGINGNEESEQLFGLAPPDSQSGDRVCILFGCSVPCILRPHLSQHGAQYYQLIGEAYVYGRMDGEAITMLSPRDLGEKTQDFVIR